MTDRPGAQIIERPSLTETLGRGREWVFGMCWLYCRRRSVPVLWLGPVHSSGVQAGMYGRADCIAELDHMVWQALLAKDNP